jgi:hypothetical protein
MGCGIPINAGFFCAKCIEAGDDSPKEDGWKGTRFAGEAKKRRQQQLFKEDLALWSRRIVIVVTLLVLSVTGWNLFGDRIRMELRAAQTIAQPSPTTDPTVEHPIQLDKNGNPVGTQAFARKHDN